MDITCPKCSYVRAPAEHVPDWQCPGCGVAYNKVGPQAEAAASRIEISYTVVDDEPERSWRRWKVVVPVALAIGLLGYQVYSMYKPQAAKAPVAATTATAQDTPAQADYRADYLAFNNFMTQWDKAMEAAYDASRTLPSSGLGTPEFNAAMARLSTLQQEWNAKTFRTACYSNTQSILADVLLTGKSHINTYATTPLIPEDTASAYMQRHYLVTVNACLPASEQLKLE